MKEALQACQVYNYTQYTFSFLNAPKTTSLLKKVWAWPLATFCWADKPYTCIRWGEYCSSTDKLSMHSQVSIHLRSYRIAGNFRGRKLSRISRFFSHPRKFSPRNSRHATPIMRPASTFCEIFLREMLLSYRSAKVFSLKNFPLYGMYAHVHVQVQLSSLGYRVSV